MNDDMSTLTLTAIAAIIGFAIGYFLFFAIHGSLSDIMGITKNSKDER